MGLLKAFSETELNILQLRKEESLTPDMKEVIDILTLDSDTPAKIVGSFRYKIHEYPADIDLYEAVRGCCSFNTSLEKIIKSIHKMLTKIKKRRFTYLSDFKAGIDERYFVEIGNYNVETGKLEDYDQYKIIQRVADLYTAKLLTKEKTIDIIRMVPAKPTAYQYYKLRDMVRENYILRWSVKELTQGYKMLPLRKKITLIEALSQGTVVKADLWAMIDDRFMEVTNWFLLVAKVNGKDTYLSEEPDMYQKSLKKEIMLYKNPGFKKHMKLAKRMWLYAISEEDHYTIQQLYALFSSPIAKLNQIQSELDILVNMVKKLSNPPFYLIMKQIAQFKTRIGTVPDIYLSDANEKQLFSYFDRALYSKNNTDTILDSLESCIEIIEDIVDIQAKKYLQKNIPRNELLKKLIRIVHKKKTAKAQK